MNVFSYFRRQLFLRVSIGKILHKETKNIKLKIPQKMSSQNNYLFPENIPSILYFLALCAITHAGINTSSGIKGSVNSVKQN